MKKELEAIKRLRPNCTFSLVGDDVQNIQWIDPADTTTPTDVEIKAEIAKMEAEALAIPSAKSALLDKLGITEEEAALLLG
jgi:hypothetical protein